MTQESPYTGTFRYCFIMMAGALAVLGAVACFNALVDPFGMYRRVEIEGFNAYKPEMNNHMRLYKAFEVARVQPQTIILGTSRTQVGLRCSHEALTRLEGPCYNLSFEGATTKEIYEYLRHAQAIRPLKHLVLGIDAYQVSPKPAFTRPDFDPLLLYSPGVPHWFRFITADLKLLTSFDMLAASIQTLRSQDAMKPSWVSPDGQKLNKINFQHAVTTYSTAGPRAYFDAIDRKSVQYHLTPPPAKHPVEPPSVPEASSLDYIRRIVEFCRAENIDLRIFITPGHAHQSEILAAFWGDLAGDYYKRSLVQVLAEDAARYPNRAPILLMDFDDYSSVATGPLPAVGSWDKIHFYWDSAHFKQIVGDYVLDRLFDVHNDARPIPSDFGVVLNAQTLDAVLAQLHKAQVIYRQRVPEEMAALHALMPGLPVLVYHQIRTARKEPWDQSTAVSLAEFESQMRYLHDQGYTTLSMNEVTNYLKGKHFQDRIVAIHFDGGWKSAQDAMPVLNRYGFKASFGIMAGADQDAGSPTMGWDEIRALAKNPHFDIFSQGGDTLPGGGKERTFGKDLEPVRQELTESRSLLEKELNRPVHDLAWPEGAYDATLAGLAKEAGYRWLLTMDDGLNRPGGDLLHIRRTVIHTGCDVGVFSQILADGKSRDCLEDGASR